MLGTADNETLTRVGPGTSMGEYLRRFWSPVLLEEELPEPDCAPVRVRLFGEDLIAFRNTSGRVGLVKSMCPHRGTDLFFGRNEEDGIRCPYHGWKFDVAGNCVEMPTENAESNFKDKVHLTAYETEEAGGIIWAYMGPKDKIPPLPHFPYFDLPANQRIATKYLRECNWLQSLEGGVDSVHTNFLHITLSRYKNTPGYQERLAARGTEDLDLRYRSGDTAPRFFAHRTDGGFLVASRRDADEDQYYWRFNQYLVPFYSVPPRGAGGGHAFVPLDDYQSWSYNISARTDRAYTKEEMQTIKSGNIPIGLDDAGGLQNAERIPGTYITVRNKSNDFLIDREMQKHTNFTGIVGTGNQDSMAQASMPAIMDRTQEHLGITDLGIIAIRRLLLKEVNDLQDGVEPPEASDAEAYHIRGIHFVEDREVTLADAVEARRESMYR
jgi:phthalate 4,5-dioxygenase oxygenase subunit